MIGWRSVFADVPAARRGYRHIGAGRWHNRTVPRDVLADRTHRFAAPRWVVYEALTGEQDRWLVLNPGEVRPTVRSAVRDESIIWSSFWPVSPDDTIEFELSRDGSGTGMRFRWLSDQPPDERGINLTRQRLNKKLASDLRAWVDARLSQVSWDEAHRR